ncbi:MAG TPA: hypothetical protein VM618_06220, partial [Acidimicrobiia bacterium]|nr:hypothetical protein [Acidimicrobiia bacterium]
LPRRRRLMVLAPSDALELLARWARAAERSRTRRPYGGRVERDDTDQYPYTGRYADERDASPGAPDTTGTAGGDPGDPPRRRR